MQITGSVWMTVCFLIVIVDQALTVTRLEFGNVFRLLFFFYLAKLCEMEASDLKDKKTE